MCPEPKMNKLRACGSGRAAAFRCVRPSFTSVFAPVGLGGRQPGNYTALTTSSKRKGQYHTHIHKNTYLHAQSIQLTQSHLHTHTHNLSCILSLSLSLPSHTHMHTVPAKYKDYIMSRRITMTPTWPGSAAALPLAWVSLNLLFGAKRLSKV